MLRHRPQQGDPGPHPIIPRPLLWALAGTCHLPPPLSFLRHPRGPASWAMVPWAWGRRWQGHRKPAATCQRLHARRVCCCCAAQHPWSARKEFKLLLPIFNNAYYFFEGVGLSFLCGIGPDLI